MGVPCLEMAIFSTSHGFFLPHKSSVIVIGEDFSPAPWDEAGRGGNWFRLFRPTLPHSSPFLSRIVKGYNCKFFIP